MARAIWKGSISFGLVNIPIGLYPATRKEELRFRLLRKTDLSPVNYKRVAEKDGKEVPWDQIVKGNEYEKGKYIVLKEEDFQRVDLEATQTVDIQDFVDQQEIDPIFFYKPYYLEPQKGGDKAYVLLHETLAKTGKVGIAKVVIKTRQYLAGVKAKDSVLVLELMHFAEELAEADKLHIPKKLEVGKRELDMAKALVDSMSSKWDPKKYRDDYREALMEVIEEKVEAGGKEIEEKPKPKPRPSTKVIDLVSVLQESLNKTKKSHHARKSSAATRTSENRNSWFETISKRDVPRAKRKRNSNTVYHRRSGIFPCPTGTGSPHRFAKGQKRRNRALWALRSRCSCRPDDEGRVALRHL